MEIEKQRRGKSLVLKINGRVDSEWATHLSDEIEEALHHGNNQILLHMEQVSFMSSAGIRVLLQFYKRLRDVGGSFGISHPSKSVRNVLEMSGLTELFECSKHSEAKTKESYVKVKKGTTTLCRYPSDMGATLSYQLIGNPPQPGSSENNFTESTAFPIDKSTLAFGLGALGAGHEECHDLFGEFLAASGAVAYLPPSGKGIPDYMLSSGSFIPEVQVLYGAACKGEFSDFIRFEESADVPGIKLSNLLEHALETSGQKKIAIVMVAESEGLKGASARKSPCCLAPREDPLAYPEICRWLSFSPERLYGRCISLVTGVVSVNSDDQTDPFLRKLSNDSELSGHFHAAAFSYTPLAQGKLSINETVSELFKHQTLKGVLHLLCDDEKTGMESEFRRGSIWMGGIK